MGDYSQTSVSDCAEIPHDVSRALMPFPRSTMTGKHRAKSGKSLFQQSIAKSMSAVPKFANGIAKYMSLAV